MLAAILSLLRSPSQPLDSFPATASEADSPRRNPYKKEGSMPTLNSIARVAAKPLPRIVSPRAQSILDYILVGTFYGAAGWFWRHSKRAAVASVLCGAAKLAVSVLTDYPGGVQRIIDHNTRRDIDLGL